MGGQGAKAMGIAYDEKVSPTLKSSLSGGNTVPDVVYACHQNTGQGWWNQSEIAQTLRTPCGGDSTKANLVTYCLQGNSIDRNVSQNGSGWAEEAANTLNTTDRHGVVYPNVARTLAARYDSSPCADRGQNVVALDCRNLNGSDVSATLQAKSNGGYSLNYQNPVVYDCRDNGEGEVAPTVTGDHQNRVTDYTGIAVHGFDMQAIGKYSDSKVSSALRSRDYKEATDLIVELNQESYPITTGALCANSHPGSYTGQDAFNDMLPVIRSSTPDRRYIVRRLIPLECCRLQGYPDGWTENLAVPDPTIEEVEFFTKVWADWAEINGTKPKSLNQVIKWLADPQSDSAEYKAYGNSLAIPCSYDVLRRIAKNG